MAATYTEISLEEMEKFLNRGYRALRPRKSVDKGEVVFDLNLSDEKIFIRVWTSIKPRSGMGAGVGQDAIKVTMVTRGGKPLVPKGKIVKRTQNWRGSMQERIEELIEDYESKTGYWKGRQQDRDNETPEPAIEPEVVPSGQVLKGTFQSLPNGQGWGARVLGRGSPGDKAILTTTARKQVPVTLGQKVWSGRDNATGAIVELWSLDRNKRACDESGNPIDLTSILLAEHMLRQN